MMNNGVQNEGTVSTTPHHEAKLLYRKLDNLFVTLDPAQPQAQLLKSFLGHLYESLREALGLRAALLYGEGSDGFELKAQFGDPSDTRQGTTPLTEERAPLALILQHGVYLFPDVDVGGSRDVLASGRAAGVAVGRRPRRHVMLFSIGDEIAHEELDFTLNAVRAALDARLGDERVQGHLRQAMEIQQSLLMDEPPRLAGYELACRSIPAEEVGGDFYDFASFNGHSIGLAIGDASGKGLPAALLVRDVVTGLRMGLEKNLKMTHVFSKLNSVIHRSNLSSRFISVFYAELDREGDLIYVNAGHPAPLVFSGDTVVPLDRGGAIVGPLPETRYRRGYTYLEPAAVLVACTDGILERRNSAGEFFGEEGVMRVVKANMSASAGEILAAVYSAAEAFGEGGAWQDDATVVVVKRQPEDYSPGSGA
jgi:sigma-B regulation protein RsbU (phosphoserine phosphatase)